MIKSNELTEVKQMFEGRSVLITGASGFIGSVLLEKLLRCYSGIKRIYVLIRAKKDESPVDRLNKHLLKSQLFDGIRDLEAREGRKLFEKIVVVPGDTSQPKLGISEADTEILVNDTTLSTVFNLAASVRFTESLKQSIRNNLIATKNVMNLCRRLPNLLAICHMSTAFVNGRMNHGEEIKEQIYPIEPSPYEMMDRAETMDEETLEKLGTYYLKRWPNIYTYTKSLAEHLIAKEATDLPIVIVRPSIVVAGHKEPKEGWVDSVNGITGIVLATSIGLIRTVHMTHSYRVDLVPVDYVVNTSIVAAFYVAKTRNHNISISNELSLSSNYGQQCKKVENLSTNKQPLMIIHSTSGDVNPVFWSTLERDIWKAARKYPSKKMVRFPDGSGKSTWVMDRLNRVLQHYFPALIIDTVMQNHGSKNSLVTTYSKMHSKMKALTYFSLHEYKFKSDNINLLRDCLTTETDRRKLYIDLKCLDWDEFLENFVLGIRRHLLNDDDSTLEEARRLLIKAYYREVGFSMTLIMVLVAFVLYFVLAG